MNSRIYADNAATTKIDPVAFEAMIPWLTEEYGNPSQPYSFSRSTKKALAEARETIASCINAEPDEIFFTSGGTESDNWAIKGAALASPNKCILTTLIEHHAILNSCNSLSKQGYRVDYVSVNDKGDVNQEDLLNKLNKTPVSIVSIMMANNEIGTIQSFSSQTERIIHESGALFHTDAVQAVGHIPIDVKRIGVDLLSASSHKFNGPRGIGFLFVKKGTVISPLLDGGSQEKGLRAGTENIASIVGMSVALKNNCKSLIDNTKRVDQLSDTLITLLNQSGIVFMRNGSSSALPGLLSLSFPNSDGEAILHRLDLMGICVSTGAACDSKKTEISHVLKAIGLKNNLARGTIRISLSKNNTMNDIITIANSLIQIFKK